MKRRVRFLIFALIIGFTATFFISWKGLDGSTAVTQVHSNFQGKTDVLQVKPDGKYSWAVLTFDLSEYAGQQITIDVSVEMWLEKSSNLMWQINNSSYPVIAGKNGLEAKQWHTIKGSSKLKVEKAKVLYLSSNQFGENTAYLADFVVTINGKVVNK